MSSTNINLCMLAICSTLVLVWAAPLTAEPPPAPDNPAPQAAETEKPAEAAQNVFLQPRREMLLYLNNAKRLIDQRRFSEAIRALGLILDSEEDYFIPPDIIRPEDDPGDAFSSLKTEARRLLGNLPEEGREMYQLQYGGKAERRLAAAAAAADTAEIAAVSSRYFHTAAGGEATLILGLAYLDRDRPLAAVKILRRLAESWDGGARFEPTLSTAMAVCWARAGFPQKAAECLELLRTRYPQAKIVIGGRQIALFNPDDDPIAWLESHTGPLYEKPATQTAAAAADAVPLLNTFWGTLPTEHPSAEELLVSQLRFCRRRNLSLLTAGRPLAVDDTVFARTLGTLAAIDLRTGKCLWMVPFDDILDEEDNSNQNARARSGQRIGALCNRYWQDAIYASLSSDGRRVYSIEELGIGPFAQEPRFIVLGGRRVENPNWSRSNNIVAAHDVRSGKLAWQIGGPDGNPPGDVQNEKPLPAAGSFFLGAPLCLEGKLYLLGELAGEIVLTAVEADSGKLLWTQPLAMVETEIARDWQRRYTAVAPHYSDGVLICPTGNGAVIAVEEATRSLLWGFSLPNNAETQNMPPGLPAFQMQRAAMAARMTGFDGSAASTWLDCTPVIVEDRVLITAPGCDYLYCLGLFDGKTHWKTLRNGDLFIACADRERVLLVGGHSARALNLSDGKPAWPKDNISLGDNASTSGRGYAAGGYYYLPAGAAGVLAIDLRNGGIARSAKSREGNLPGNLVRHQGTILSQGLDGLKSYHELDSLRVRVDAILAKQPDDPVALAYRGEILIDEGKLAEAVATLRRSNGVKRGARTEWLLRETLLDGLEENFAEYRASSKEIESLCSDSAHLARYLRLMSQGLQNAGEWDAALDCYLRLAALSDGETMTVFVGDAHKVRLDRWLRTRLASFREAAPEPSQRRLDTEVQSRLQTAVASKNADAMRRLLDQFAYLPAAVAGRENFVNLVISGGNAIEAEMLLRQEARSRDRATSGRATARLAELLRKSGRAEDAAACYVRLAHEFGDVDCAAGLTGRQIVERLAADDEVRRWFQPDKSWPVGAVEVSETAFKQNPRRSMNVVDLNFFGSPLPFFGGQTLKLEQGKQIVVGLGGYGNLLWQVSLAQGGLRTYLPINQNEAHVSARGHLLVLAAGNQFSAVECVDPRRPRLLWRRHAEETLSSMGGINQAEINAFWAGMRPAAGFVQPGRSPWQSALLTDQYMCYAKSRGVAALDPLSGRELWTRDDLSGNLTLFGDENLLFAASADSSEAVVLRGDDGEKLKNISLPTPGDRLAAIGRNILVWRAEADSRILELLDPWQDRVIWGPHKFQANARCHLVGNEALGVMEPNGKFTLFSLPGGKKIVDAQLEPEPTLHEIIVLEADGEYFLVTHSTPRRQSGFTPRAIRGTASRLIRQGRVYGFARDGRRLWPDFPQGVEVKQQQLIMSQPGRLPVLTFAAMGYEPKNAASRWFTSVFMIDKRNGRVVLDRKFDQQTGDVELVGDPATNTVDLRMQLVTARLTFTGAPLPPVPKKLPTGLKSAGTLDGVLKAFEKATRRQIQQSPPPIPEIMPKD